MTLLLMIITGAVMYHVGNYYGYKRGEREAIHRTKRIRSLLSEVSRSGK